MRGEVGQSGLPVRHVNIVRIKIMPTCLTDFVVCCALNTYKGLLEASVYNIYS